MYNILYITVSALTGKGLEWFSHFQFSAGGIIVSRAICWAVVMGWAGLSYRDARFWKTSAPFLEEAWPSSTSKGGLQPLRLCNWAQSQRIYAPNWKSLNINVTTPQVPTAETKYCSLWIRRSENMPMMKQITYFLLYYIMIIMLQHIKILCSEKFPYYFMTPCSRFSTTTAKIVKVFPWVGRQGLIARRNVSAFL